MIYGLQVVTPPSIEPFTTGDNTADDLCLAARVSTSSPDVSLLSSYGTTARELIESWIGRAFITQTLRMGFDVFPFGSPDIRFIWNRFGIIRLPRNPVQSVSSIVYVAADGTTTTHSPTLYQVDTMREPARIAPAFSQVWPVARYTTFNAITVDFIAGYGATLGSVPARAKTAIRLLAAHLYANREAAIPSSLYELPLGLQSMISSLSYGEYV
jgi:uncharacterized phiE125 gp8 family phage protein